MVRPLADTPRRRYSTRQRRSLAVLSPGIGGQSTVSVVPSSGAARPVPLPGPATAMTGDNDGRVYASTRGGYFRVDLRAGTANRVDIEGQPGTDFTAIARRADGKLVLGSADGAVYTLSSDSTVGASLKIFARVDALVTQGNTAVVLDRGQTSVTTISASGNDAEHALRAGEGATTMAADSAGRVLVADTRGDELLVFGTDPLILRQRYPVRDAPYGLAGSSRPGLGVADGDPTRWLVTIWQPASPWRRCVIEPCSSPTPWPSTKHLAPCMWCPARERVCR